MPLRVLIIQSDEAASQALSKLVAARGDQAWHVSEPARALPILEEVHPELIFLDLHLPGNDWLTLLRQIRRQSPETRVIITNKHPDFQRELFAREQGASVFLREPFTERWMDQAIQRVFGAAPKPAAKRSRRETHPHVRFPVRWKITLPYLILAAVLALAGGYVVSQVVLESIQDRFDTQLVETATQNADWMVQEENRLLETLRLVSNLDGMAGMLQAADAERLRQMVLPLAINANEEAIELLDVSGVSILSLRHDPGAGPADYTAERADSSFAGWDFVRYVLDRRSDQGRDKSSGVAHTAWGDQFYVSGPVLDANGQLAGVALVGESLTTLTRKMRSETLADVNLYDPSGKLLVSSLTSGQYSPKTLSPEQVASILSGQDRASLVRDLPAPSLQYAEILGPWEVRAGTDLGVMGTALPKLFLVKTSRITRAQISLLIGLGLAMVGLVGIYVASQITRPLHKVVKASAQVAQGNLEVKLDSAGNDEIAVLAHSFNTMIAGLQEGSMYRDLLGRTISPEVREQLRQTFSAGNLRLEGQEAVATVFFSDIRGFTNISERVDPASVFNWLNEYLGVVVPIITANGGVINKFDGDAVLAFFGILPRITSAKQSAYSACCAATQILSALERLNIQRIERGEPPLATGVGINTGVVVAGGLGTSDRLHYTIIGDTVNTTQRLEALARQLFGTSGVILTQSTLMALEENRAQFRLDALGLQVMKGKAEKLQVYRLLPLTEAVTTMDTPL